MDISQKVYVEEDPTKNCANYPTDEYETYNDCDRKTALAELAKIISPDLYPLWAAPSTNLSSVSKEPVYIQNSSAYMMTHVNYANGLKVTSCRLPCTLTKTLAKSYMDQESLGSGFSVNVNQDMQVTQTSLVQFDHVKFLCDIGGMLGLWLDLGAMQLGELLVTTAQLVQSRAPTAFISMFI